MNHRLPRGGLPHRPTKLVSTRLPRVIPSILSGVWRGFCQALPALLVVTLWFVTACVLPLKTLRESRHGVRLELTHLLQTNRPDVPAVLETFGRATEQVLLSASGPYFILGLSTLFLIAHLTLVKRRLRLAERNIQTLRDVVFGVNGIPL